MFSSLGHLSLIGKNGKGVNSLDLIGGRRGEGERFSLDSKQNSLLRSLSWCVCCPFSSHFNATFISDSTDQTSKSESTQSGHRHFPLKYPPPPPPFYIRTPSPQTNTFLVTKPRGERKISAPDLLNERGSSQTLIILF